MHNTPQNAMPPGWIPASPDDTTIANDATRTMQPQQPQRQPRPAPAKHVKLPRHAHAPQWPVVGQAGRVRGSQYSRSARPPAPAPVAPYGTYRAPQDRRVLDAIQNIRSRLPHFHVIHLILLAGVGALWLAITQAWGYAGGNPVYIQDFSIPNISDPSVNVGQFALQTASGIAMVAVALAIVLLLVNVVHRLLTKLLRGIGLSALATILFIPLLALLILLLVGDLVLAAGFGGLSILSQLPFVRDNGFASVGVAHAAIGFYLWWFGIGATLIGAIGEAFIERP